MAHDLNQDSYFTFDQVGSADSRKRVDSTGGPAERFKGLAANRYAMLGLIFILAGALIFYNTATLQFNGSAIVGVAESSGISRQQTVTAPRGDILDANGIPLAYSKPISVLSLTYAGLESDELNTMLLDLAEMLNEEGVAWSSKLESFLAWSHDGCGHEETVAGFDCGAPAFAKDWDAILYWQTDRYQLGLSQPPAGATPSVENDWVKQTPRELFDYLLYNRYEIEKPGQDRQYTDGQAYQIMKLRYTIMVNDWMFRNGTPLEIARNVTETIINVVNEQNFRFRGVMTGRDSTRVYTPDASLVSHVIGYTGRISSGQYEELKPLGYAPDAMVGQSGVEQVAERYLAGQSGVKPYNIWTVAGEEGTFFSETIGKDPVPGFDVRLTIDLPLQKVAQTALAETIATIRENKSATNRGDADAGSVVMLDVKTGAVLAMASYPYYDPNDFILQLSDEAAADRVDTYLTDNQQKPMLNRAIQEIYAPGSTFKPVTAVAGLETGTITPFSSTIRCVGTQTIANWNWRCLEYPARGHGDLTLERGMATSCNMYFYHLGNMTGIDAIDHWGGILGLGELTGIDLPGESKGFRSSRQTKALLRSNPPDQIWYPADTCQTAIGQFDNSYTVLQLATYTAALATGNKVTPHVIDTITTPEGVLVKDNSELKPVPLPIQASTLTAVREAMVAVTQDEEGTAAAAFADFPVLVAAKTGTAETGLEDVSSSNGLFICFAPADNPQVAIAQIVEKGAWGSNTIGIAEALLTEYFDLNQESAGQVDQTGLVG